MKVKLVVTNEVIEVYENETLYQILMRVHKNDYFKYLGAKVNNKLKGLCSRDFKENDKIEFIDITNSDGHRIYVRTLSLIYVKACKEVYNDIDVSINYSLNKGLYTELQYKNLITKKHLNAIKNKMKDIIDAKKTITTYFLSVDKATEVFSAQGMMDKVEMLNYWDKDSIRVYELDGYYDTFYGYLAPNTGFVNKFDLRLFYPGIILNYPTRESNFELPEYIEQKKLSKVFKEAEDWGEIMDVAYVGALNKKIVNNTISDMIRVNEALHEKKIAYIADEITSDKNIKIVLIAGPSSSGKTTFAQRLSIQLRVNGKETYAISLDDYFVDRHLTPRDENGDLDFETIDALDLDLFNEQLIDLMAGERVQIPVYNFKEGKREYTREPVKLTSDHIIIIEGIHGLNDELTKNIPQVNKFKVYISALTQLNIDRHNRIATSDLRLLRRIVRDYTHRGNNAVRTIELWDNVVRGAEKYIFPYQENADAIFNSALVYELCVLKKYAEPIIMEIDEDSSFYSERQRLLKFLSYFLPIEDESAIPNNSILREFIGESCFR
ncbi:MAG: nucleoside kinase [Tissierellia bacterium]|jgi:uridine kinase|nr:nucleoside kinase [Tissierellia bacterium]MDD3226370.1 nucleoside kinase [Tissierellia bacterium]MDD3750721.1 nucleoside kinase [Tissierellia bacterium]MDD4046025.1 nucleoside kinase [Tissierellia bacterium]MDD4677884.1 nucleoside kinase [Tissierellia bacterium]